MEKKGAKVIKKMITKSWSSYKRKIKKAIILEQKSNSILVLHRYPPIEAIMFEA